MGSRIAAIHRPAGAHAQTTPGNERSEPAITSTQLRQSQTAPEGARLPPPNTHDQAPLVHSARGQDGEALDGGKTLPLAVRASLESRFGQNFADVRIHADGRAAVMAGALAARAFTLGNHIVFGKREYTPDTVEGRGLLAHELAHVVQQRSVRMPATGHHAGLPVNRSRVLESTADHAAGQALRGQQVTGLPATGSTAHAGAAQLATYYDQKGKQLGNDGASDDIVYLVADSAEAKAVKKADKSGGTTAPGTLVTAIQLPPRAVRQAMVDAAAATAAPGSTDTEGGFHEEGGYFGTSASTGAPVVVPAAPGAKADPSIVDRAEINPFNAANPGAVPGDLVVTGYYHTHPGGEVAVAGAGPAGAMNASNALGDGGQTHSFEQVPSGHDVSGFPAIQGRHPSVRYGYMIATGSRAEGGQMVYLFDAGGIVAQLPLKTLKKLI